MYNNGRAETVVSGGTPSAGTVDLTTTGHNNNNTNAYSNANTVLPPAGLGLTSDPSAVSVGSDDPFKGRNAKTVQEIVDKEDEEADVADVGRCCKTVFLPLLLFLLLSGTLLGVVYTSGRSPKVEAVPRAVLFIIEGFKGTTFTRLLEQHRLPHLRRMLVEQQGLHAVCRTVGDARCARVAVVEDDRTGGTYTSAAAGVTNIITGVSPRRHLVWNDSSDAFHAFTETSMQFPSVAMRVTRAGLRVLGLGTSRLLNAFLPTTNNCGAAGILDAECAIGALSSVSSTGSSVRGEIPLSGFNTSTTTTSGSTTRGENVERAGRDVSPLMSCLHQHSCNLFQRILTLSSSTRDGREERQYTRQLLDIFGGLFDEKHETPSRGSDLDKSLFIFHFNALARRAEDANMPEFTYDSDSLEYAAQAFLIDSLIGQVLTFVRDHAHSRQENWLVVGTSDHGGSGKSFGHSGEEDEVVPFFVATYTPNGRGYTKLRPLLRPVTHMDAVPTILKWLGLAPYEEQDTEEKDVEKKKNEQKENPVAAGLSDDVDNDRKSMDHMNENSKGRMGGGMNMLGGSAQTQPTSASAPILDGRPQAICGSGLRPRDCREEKRMV